MILKPGTRVKAGGKIGYFQTVDRGTLLISYEDGSMGWYTAHEVLMEEDPKENILREFIGYAAENQVAPTDLVNLALKALE